MHTISKWLVSLLILSYYSIVAPGHALSSSARALQFDSQKQQQSNVVTWDEHSILVRGQRVMLFSGEFHPFRLPSPGLWLDIFEKIRSMGYTAVSFYLDWALLEGERGHVRAEGIFSLEPFFEAAQRAGLYLIARPGPYINAETSGGGLPGWLQRNKGRVRSTARDYIESTQNYLDEVLCTIAKFQIIRGGPIIMVQYENEYSISDTPESLAVLPKIFGMGEVLDSDDIDTLSTDLFSDYMEYIKQQFTDAGIAVPLMINDAVPAGNWAPNTGKGAADIYTIDDYPFPYGFTCTQTPDTRLILGRLLTLQLKVAIQRCGPHSSGQVQSSTTLLSIHSAQPRRWVSPSSKEVSQKLGLFDPWNRKIFIPLTDRKGVELAEIFAQRG